MGCICLTSAVGKVQLLGAVTDEPESSLICQVPAIDTAVLKQLAIHH